MSTYQFNNIHLKIDKPFWEVMQNLPSSTVAGACLSADRRATGRYVYYLVSATSFWRYDTIADSYMQLASPVTFTMGSGCAMAFDPSQGTSGRIWLISPLSTTPFCVFQYYDIALNTWTQKTAPTTVQSGLATQLATDASLAHTCSTYNVAGNDDCIYMTFSTSTIFLRYSIVGDSWSAMTSVTGSVGAGQTLIWIYGSNTNSLFLLRGGGYNNIYIYSITGNSWTTKTYNPNSETYTTGSSCVYDGVNRVYIQKDATQRVYHYQLDEDVLYNSCMGPYSQSTAVVGNKMFLTKPTDGGTFLYLAYSSRSNLFRTYVWW